MKASESSQSAVRLAKVVLRRNSAGDFMVLQMGSYKMLKKLCLIAVAVMLLPHGAGAATVQFDVTIDSSTNGTGSSGLGEATVFLNDITGQLDVTGTFSGLQGNVSNLHLHGLTGSPGSGNAGVLVGGFTWDAGTTSGSFSRAGGTVPSGSIDGVLEGRSYLNIHTTAFGGGEIRGYLLNPTAIPEPGTFAVLAFVTAGASLRRRRRS